MNKQLLLDVAQAIEKDAGKHFDMEYWTAKNNTTYDHCIDVPAALKKGCGTTCCIAGWTISVAKQQGLDVEGEIESEAARLLGLDQRQAEWLFYGRFASGVSHTKPAEAVAELRRLASVA